MTFEKKLLEMFCKKHNISGYWQQLRFDAKKFVIETANFDEHRAVFELLCKIKDAHVSFWTCHEGQFEGYVYVMSQLEHMRLEAALTGEWRSVEAWWQRYHNADEETRRLMACGAIA